MSLPHNTPPRIGQKFQYFGAVIEFAKVGDFAFFENIYYFRFLHDGRVVVFQPSEFANLNLKALT